MADVVSFRPTPEERALIEKTRRAEGFRTRAEAVRFLLKKGAEATGSVADDPVFRFRVPAPLRAREGVTSRDIDDLLYGSGP